MLHAIASFDRVKTFSSQIANIPDELSGAGTSAPAVAFSAETGVLLGRDEGAAAPVDRTPASDSRQQQLQLERQRDHACPVETFAEPPQGQQHQQRADHQTLQTIGEFNLAATLVIQIQTRSIQ